MIYCDFCYSWFHTKCEGLKSLNSNRLQEEYRCLKCNIWLEKVQKFFMPSLKGDELKVQPRDETFGRTIL